MNNLVTGEYLVWNSATASFCQNNLVCPASDQVSISKSGFQIASPPFFSSFFLFMFLRMRNFVSTGYSNLWCPFSPVCRRKREGTILSRPIRIKQYGSHGRQYGFLAVLLFVGLHLLRKFFLTTSVCCGLSSLKHRPSEYDLLNCEPIGESCICEDASGNPDSHQQSSSTSGSVFLVLSVLG